MADYQLSGKAEEDLIDIYTYSWQEFGEIRADAYLQALEEKFLLLAESPFIGRAIDHIRPGYRRFEHASHSVFYTVGDQTITVMRVLHNRQDVDQALGM